MHGESDSTGQVATRLPFLSHLESAFDGFSRLPLKGLNCRGEVSGEWRLSFANGEGRTGIATCTVADAAPRVLQGGRGVWIRFSKSCARSFSAAIAVRIYCQEGTCDVSGIPILIGISSLGYAKRDRGTTSAKSTTQP